MAEQVTITLDSDSAERVRAAVAGGTYLSAGDVIRQALSDWELAEAHRARALDSLRQAIEVGIADIEAGRVRDFDVDDILAEGRQRRERVRAG